MLNASNTMEIIQLIIGITLLISIKLFVIRLLYNIIRIYFLSGDDLKFDDIRPIYKPLKKGQNPKAATINKFASNLEHRILVYELLHTYDKTDLFPAALLTIEKSSESYLANWLLMNTDFDSLPSELNYLNTMELQHGFTVFVYNFKVYEPHIYANRGHMIAYVAYESSKMDVYSKPYIILSTFEKDTLTVNQLEQYCENV